MTVSMYFFKLHPISPYVLYIPEKRTRGRTMVNAKMLQACDSERIFKRAVSRVRLRNFLTCHFGVFMRISNFKCKFAQKQPLVTSD